uniref:hypothetical protein n=1 Tax=Acidaminococcus intestini TaxID=187327 RepID=UPI0026DD6713
IFSSQGSFLAVILIGDSLFSLSLFEHLVNTFFSLLLEVLFVSLTPSGECLIIIAQMGLLGKTHIIRFIWNN